MEVQGRHARRFGGRGKPSSLADRRYEPDVKARQQALPRLHPAWPQLDSDSGKNRSCYDDGSTESTSRRARGPRGFKLDSVQRLFDSAWAPPRAQRTLQLLRNQNFLFQAVKPSAFIASSFVPTGGNGGMAEMAIGAVRLGEIEPRERVGAQTGRKYEYQYERTARAALGLLADGPNHVCVYCDWHDDYVIEIGDPPTRYEFHQVKGRKSSQGPWSFREFFGVSKTKAKTVPKKPGGTSPTGFCR